jgi:EmrB/QacA subfamily drug resistance transporter
MKTSQSVDKNSVLLVTTIASFMLAFMSSSLTIALPKISIELAMDAVSLGWIVAAYTMTSVIFVIPFGKIADIYGRKRIYTFGMIAFAVTSLLLAMSNSGVMLIALRFLQGAGGALLTSTSVAILASAFPANERGKVLGINVTAVYLGFSLGPFIGGLLTQYLGWRSIFLIAVPVELIAIAITFWKVKGDWVEAKGEKLDIIGSIVYGFTHLPDIFGIWLIVIGVIGFAIFIIWESKVKSPMLEINLFLKNQAFTLSCLATLVNYGATWGVGFLLSLYLQYIKGFNPQDAGLILISQPLIQAIFSPLAGRISDRFQPRLLASAGMTSTSIGLSFFIFLNNETTVLFVIGGLLLIGFGTALFIPPNTNAAMSYVDRRYYGVASAALTTMRQFGMIVSMGLVMLLFALYIGRVQITPEYYGVFLQSVQMAFIIFTSLCFLGIFAALARGKTVTDNL